MTRLTVSRQAERALDGWLEGLMQGTIPVWALPPSLARFYYLGETHGRAERQPEIDELERDLNRWYYRATTTPQQRRDDIERRLTVTLEAADEATWARIETTLRAIRDETTEYRLMNSSRGDYESPDLGVLENDGNPRGRQTA